ncbi:MAG: M48 family metalloprotease [Kofleriaceae bacterium]|nr:M48 family metalloprotease [Kofleriaceae bacterium]
MALGSLIGFALVFVFCAWTISAIAGLWGAVWTHRQLGAAAEKRAAALSLMLPPMIAGIIVLCLAGFSVLPESLGMADHCDSHGHHLHLCLVHGGEWANRTWAMSLIAVLAAILAMRLVRLGNAIVGSRRRLRIIERSSVRIQGGDIPVFLAPSSRPFCFVSGFFSPRIFVASCLWERLSAEERCAVLSHERMHVANGDLWRSVVLQMFSLFGAPVFSAWSKQRWDDATERLCDRMAADEVDDAGPIASALVNWARPQRLGVALSFLPRSESVEDRVVAVLSQEDTGHIAARSLLIRAAIVTGSITLLTLSLADPLHHAFETLFGLI